MYQKYQLVSGAVSSTNASATNAVIAAPATGKTIRLTAFVVTVTTAAVGGSGVVTLKDGTTVIQRWDANAVGSSQVNLGDQIGYPLTINNALNLVVESAVTTQATAYASAVGYIMG